MTTMAPAGDNNNKVQVRITYPATALRRHFTTSAVILFYLCLLVIPWILTCVLSFYPLSRASYTNGDSPLSSNDVASLRRWAQALAFLNGAQAVLAIPLTSFIVARAAVVFAQRKSAKAEPLAASDVFALSARQWENPWWIKFGARTWTGTKSSFLALGTLLVALALVTPPLRSLLVETEQELVPITSRADSSVRINGASIWPDQTWSVVGYDPDGAGLNQTRLSETVPMVATGVQLGTEIDFQPYLWAERSPAFQYDDYDPVSPQPGSPLSILVHANETRAFVSALPNGTSTGVVRDYALRLGSTVGCTRVDKSAFPSPCPGEKPFTSNLTGPNVGISVCVPGNYLASPWHLSLDRQDVIEDLYLDVQVSQALANLSSENENANDWFRPFTVHCQSGSTKGYFELPNARNGYQPGPVMSQFDVSGFLGYHSKWPYDNNSDPPKFWESITPGPLTTASVALFGNTSFLHRALTAGSNNPSITSFEGALTSVLQDTCAAGAMPFGTLQIDTWVSWPQRPRNFFTDAARLCQDTLGLDGDSDRLDRSAESRLYYYLRGYGDAYTANMSLAMAVFYANEALLRRASVRGLADHTTRPVYGSDGVAVPQPRFVSFPALVALSVLVGLQALLLIALWAYILSTPVWTDSLDALVAARVGARSSLLRSAAAVPDDGVARRRLARGLDEIEVVFAEAVAGDSAREMGVGGGGAVRRITSSPRESLVSELTVIESL